jgi:glycosyltransferase involved in cell wall biosynthesis
MSKGSAARVAVIIPAYNEGAVIYDVVRDIHETLQKEKLAFEVIVIDDGSKDATAREARRAGAHVISHLLNSGSGGATATGISFARQKGFDIAVTADADGQHHAQDVVKGILLMMKGDADLLIGSRLIDAKGMSRVKILGNRGLSTVTRIIFGVRVTDSQSGLRLFSKRALETLQWRTNGYEFCSEMLWRAKQRGLRIEEYPIRVIYTDYSKGKGQNNWNGVNILRSLLLRRIMEIFHE